MKQVTDVNRACSRQPIITTSIPAGNYLRSIAGQEVRHALDFIALEIPGAGSTGKAYNIGGVCEKTNIEMVHAVCDMIEELHPLADNDATRDQAPAIAQYREPAKR